MVRHTATVKEASPYVAETTAALSEAVEGATVGDRVAVRYIRNGTVSTASGTVTDTDTAHGDVRFRTANGDCYLHVNTSTGDYYFTDAFPASPEGGRRITHIEVTPRSN